jgi:hypothetical protein
METPIEKLLEYGISIVALMGVSYYVVRLTNWLFGSFSDALNEHKEITIRLIDGLNSVRGELCQLKIELAELREQHRNYHDLFIIARPDRMSEPSERKKPRPRVRRTGD